MMDLFLVLTGMIIAIAMFHSYGRYRDPLHPMLICGVFCMYMFAIRPLWMINKSNAMDYFRSDGQMEMILFINMLSMLAFCVGCFKGSGRESFLANRKVSFELSPAGKRKVYSLALLIGFIAVAAYTIPIMNRGGFTSVYGRAKAMSYVGSGYIAELPLLSIPAIVLLFMGRRGQRLRFQDIALALLFASPHLIHGILGARRGPTFIVLGTLFFSWYVVSGRRPSLAKTFLALTAAGVFIVFLVANRHEIYIGSTTFEADSSSFFENFLPTNAGHGDDFVYPCALIATADSSGKSFWGTRLFVQLVVRIIPSAIWPTKYHDVGFGWMETGERMHGYTDAEWMDAVGWIPVSGAAAGFIADGFVEFSWGTIFLAGLFGYAYGTLWRRAVMVGGIFVLLYLLAAILSIYLPTQSITALMYRYMFMSIPIIILWRMQIQPLERLVKVIRRIQGNQEQEASP